MGAGRPPPARLPDDPAALPARRSRGRLRIYFGAAPGGGKTDAMLADAQERKAAGLDVVIGLVETHGLAHTESLCQGLEAVAPRHASAAGGEAGAVDVAATLRRRPQLVLIDDLAHANPEGSAHLQRWEDAEELLESGIDVHATLNVQNIESLRQLVHALASLPFRQTVPDDVFDNADEIVIVDVPPEDLIDRLAKGHVVLPLPERMRRDLFRREPLMAMRHLALQSAAGHAEAQRRRQGRAADGTVLWPASGRLLVCIDHRPGSEKLMRIGRRLASVLHADWIVAYCESGSDARPTIEQREEAQASLRLAEEWRAEVVTVGGFDLDERIAELVRQRCVERVVIARPSGTPWQRWRTGRIRRTLDRRTPEVDVFEVSVPHSSLVDEAERRPVTARLGAGVRGAVDASAYGWAVAVTGVATLASMLLFKHAGPTGPLIVYLVGVLFVASRYGFWPSAATAVLSLLASDYLLFPPYFSLAVERPQDIVTLAVFVLAALVASRLTAELRFQGLRARQREQRVRFLYEFTRSLARVQSAAEVAQVAERHIPRELPWRCRLLLADAQGTLRAEGADASGQAPFDLGLAQRVFDNRRAAGWGASIGADDRDLYLPVSGPTRRYGVLALRPTRPAIVLLPEQRRVLDTAVAQISQTLERIRLAGAAHAATAQAETESLRNSLLSAIAHDLRTPLASIVAASSTLLQGKARLSDEQARELALTILEEGQRMAKLANNTLDIARLEAGRVRLDRQWYPLDEIVGAVLSRMEDRLHGHRIETRLPEGVPMAHVDLVLIVQVLENLVENAIKYTPEGTRIEIAAEPADGGAVFRVADEGPGIAAGEDSRIFEKFYRGQGRGKASGVGLGLTICRIIVEAHGGRITAHNRPHGGAEFRFDIPALESAPELRPED